MAPRPVTGHQGGARRVFGAFFSEGGIRCFPGRTLSCPNTTWTAVVERQASAGRQAGRNGAGSAVIRGSAQGGDASSRGLAGHRMPARRMTGGPRSTARSAGRQDGEGRPRGGLGAAVADRRDLSAAGGARRRQGLAYFFFIMSKNSALVLVTRILSRMNSMDCTSSMSWMNLRSTQTFCSRSGAISSSSRRVPDLFRLMAG